MFKRFIVRLLIVSAIIILGVIFHSAELPGLGNVIIILGGVFGLIWIFKGFSN